MHVQGKVYASWNGKSPEKIVDSQVDDVRSHLFRGYSLKLRPYKIRLMAEKTSKFYLCGVFLTEM